MGKKAIEWLIAVALALLMMQLLNIGFHANKGGIGIDRSTE